MTAPTPTVRLVSISNIPPCFYDETTQPRSLKKGIEINPTNPDTLHISFNDAGIAFNVSYDQIGMHFSDSQEYFFTLNSATNMMGKSILSACPINSGEQSTTVSAVLFYFPDQSFSVIIEPSLDGLN